MEPTVPVSADRHGSRGDRSGGGRDGRDERDERSDAWLDLTRTAFFSGLGPQTSGPVGIAYHRYRLASGGLVTADATRGAVYLSFTEPESQWANH